MEVLIEKARLAEQTERFEDMAKFMKQVAKELNGDLNAEQRNFFSVAYKNVVGSRRNAWQVLSRCAVTDEKDKSGVDKSEVTIEYMEEVGKELHGVCDEVLDLVESSLIPNSSTVESKVFFLKMAGDYHRYKAEVMRDDAKKDTVEKAEKSYRSAYDKAIAELAPTHPILLGLALNFSVFYYEIMNDQEQACTMAKTAFDNSMKELDVLQEDSYKDSSLIMQLMRDNLTLWTTGPQGDGERSEDEEGSDNDNQS